MPLEGLQLFGGDWTERKLDALQEYLKAYAKALSKTKFNRYYIDAFAGTGYREQRAAPSEVMPTMFTDELDELAAPEPQQFLDGSAKIALQVQPAFHHFVFIEAAGKKVEELKKLKVEFPQFASCIDIREGDANKAIRALCDSWDTNGARGVLFLDPFGMQAEWATIEAVAQTRCIDTWILFPFAVNRLMTKSPADIPPAWRNRLDMLFGTNQWESEFYRERTHSDIFEGERTVIEKRLTLHGLGTYYGKRLQSTFPVVAPNPCVLKSDQNRPLFQFFFAAANPGRGGEIALKIASHILNTM